MSQFSPSDLHLRRQIDEARSAGGWIPWTCTGVALTWWGGAAAYVYGKIGLDAVMALPPAELGGGLALAFAPGFAMIMAGFMGRESVRSARANALVLTAASEILAPADAHADKIITLGDAISRSTEEINDRLQEAENRVAVLRRDIEKSAVAAMKAAEIVRADADALKLKLSEERSDLQSLSDGIKKQVEGLNLILPEHAENLSRAAANALDEVRRGGRELDERIKHVDETSRSLAGRIASLDQMGAESRKRAQSLVTSLLSITEQLDSSSRTVDNAVKAGELAVEASRTTADAIRQAMDAALDGARDSAEELNVRAETAKAASEEAIRRLAEAARAAEASVRSAMSAAHQHAEQTEHRMDEMSRRMYDSATQATQAAEAGLERARQRIERASSLLNGLDDPKTAAVSAAPLPPAQPQGPPPPQSPVVHRHASMPVRPPPPPTLDPAPPLEIPPIPSRRPPRAQDLTPFDPLEEIPASTPAPRAPSPMPQRPAMGPSTKPTASANPPADSDDRYWSPEQAPVPPSAQPGGPGQAATESGRPPQNQMTWRDLLSGIDQPEEHEETALAFVDQLGRAGIRLKRAIRSSDLRRIASATHKGERFRRKATRQAAPGELQQIERLLRQDRDLRIAAESYLAIEEAGALKFLEAAERAREDAGPRLAAYLLLDAALDAR